MENIPLTWLPHYLAPVLSVSFFVVGFLIYHFTSISQKIANRFFNRWGEVGQIIYFVYFQRVTGFVFIGAIPFLLTGAISGQNFTEFGIGFSFTTSNLLWILSLVAVVVTVNFFTCRKPSMWQEYPRIRVGRWNRKVLFFSALTWVLYLIGYELTFRGLLLFTYTYTFGAIPAIIINLSFYCFAHVSQGIKESVGSIPFGIIMCVITLTTGTVWIAVIVHIALALSNEWMCIAFNPKISIVKS